MTLTGKENQITITANEKMSDFEIEQAIRDAETYAAQDNTRRSALEVTQEAQKLLTTSEQSLAKCGKQIDKAEKKQVKADIAALRKILFKTKPANLTEGQITDIRSAMNVLEGSSSHVRSLAGDN